MSMIGAVTPEQLRDDLATAVGHLRDAGASTIGVTGFCMGGWFTYRAALWARELGVAAAVAFYGGGIARELGTPAVSHAPVLRRPRRVHLDLRHRRGAGAPR